MSSATDVPGRDARVWVRRAVDGVSSPVPISITLAFVIGAIFVWISGADPMPAYRAMFEGSLTGSGLVNTFERAIPIMAMALALVVPFRAGVFNLGGEGQMVLGGLAGTIVAISVPGPGPAIMILALVAAATAGGLWAAVSATLQNRLGVPILISSLLLNYPARYFTSYLVRFPLKEEGSSLVATEQVPTGTRLPVLVDDESALGGFLGDVFGDDSTIVRLATDLNWSLLIVIAVFVAIVVVNRRTPFGFESGLAGLNPHFAEYGGVRLARMRQVTMIASGGISGLVGIMLVLGSQFRLTDGALTSTNYAWTGLLVALLAANRPVGAAAAGAFFAALIVGGEAMQRAAGVSGQISQVIQALVIILITFRIRLGRRRDDAASAAEHHDDSDDIGRI